MRRSAIGHHNCFQKTTTKSKKELKWCSQLAMTRHPNFHSTESWFFFSLRGFDIGILVFFSPKKFVLPCHLRQPHILILQLIWINGELERSHLIRHHYYNIIWNLNLNKRLPFHRHRLNRPEKYEREWMRTKKRTFWLSNEREKSESEETRKSWISILWREKKLFLDSL